MYNFAPSLKIVELSRKKAGSYFCSVLKKRSDYGNKRVFSLSGWIAYLKFGSLLKNTGLTHVIVYMFSIPSKPRLEKSKIFLFPSSSLEEETLDG